MGSIHFCDQQELINKASVELKKVDSIKGPVWAAIVKTGMHKQRPPSKNDWWYTRSASVLRQIYLKGPVGVSKLRTRYGGNKNRGMKPERFYKGSGSIIRKIFQQLEAAGFVKKDEKSLRKGRLITAEGKKFLDAIASQLSKAPPKPEAKKEKPKPVAKKAETKASIKKEKESKTVKKEIVLKKDEKKSIVPKKEEKKEIVLKKEEKKEEKKSNETIKK